MASLARGPCSPAALGPSSSPRMMMSLGLQAPHRMGSERSWALKGVDVGVGEPKTPRSPPNLPTPTPHLRRAADAGDKWPVNFLISAQATGPCQEQGGPTQRTQHGVHGPAGTTPTGSRRRRWLPHCAALGGPSPQGPPGAPLPSEAPRGAPPLQGPPGPTPGGRGPDPPKLKAPGNLGLCPRRSVFQINYNV